MPDELNEICNLKHISTDEGTLAGASILLESYVEAKLHYDRLPEKSRKEFDSYPISNLWVGK